LAYREYWCDELDSLRKPLQLDECRLDPATPSKLYVKAQGQWFVADSHDHAKVRGLSLEAQFLERYKTIEVASVNKKSRRLAAQTHAERIEKLELSNATLSVPSDVAVAPANEIREPEADSPEEIDFEALPEIPEMEDSKCS